MLSNYKVQPDYAADRPYDWLTTTMPFCTCGDRKRYLISNFFTQTLEKKP